MTPLESLRATVSQKATEGFAEAVLRKAVVHHTRKGIREGCYCEWCYNKRVLAHTFSYHTLYSRGMVRVQDYLPTLPIPRPYACYDFDDHQWATTTALKEARKIRRHEVRKELRSFRETVLF